MKRDFYDMATEILRARERERRNAELKARLSRPASSAALLSELRALRPREKETVAG